MSIPTVFWLSLMNFVLFVGGLAVLLRRPLKNFLATRRRAVASAVATAQKAEREALEQSEAIQSRLQHVEAEITKMRQEAQAAGEHEKQEIIQKAEAFAEKSQLETSQLVEQEVRRIKKSLRGKTVDIAILMAERLLQEQITPDDQGRLAQQFVQRLGSLH